ncbi:MAG: DUF4445 domain-containing protein, partial [Chloroflexi bacterium]|nr:DUF4445 domain-containing protein [Chloroflexota bacterium]
CWTHVNKDMVVYIGESHPDLEYHQILKTGHLPLFPTFPLEPLIDQPFVALLPSNRADGLSELGQIKHAIGTDYQGLQASLHCLRTLPTRLKDTRLQGAAVIHNNCLIGWQEWERVGSGYGLVFDLGTSTLVGKLIRLNDGGEVAVISRLNSQRRYGTNVVSRLQFIKEHANGLDYLHNLLVDDVNRITKRLLEVGGLEQEDIFISVAAGNTTMQHIFLNLPPDGIAEAPFSPLLTDGLVVKAADVGLRLNPEALLYTMPVKSGYIGGDLLSVILASGAAEQDEEIILGLDFGTNAEIFLGNRKRFLTCSAAAGPALEGARISQGMIAKAGAIEAAYIEDGNIHYRDVGNIKPKGICGSGLVDLVAILLHIGIINDEGLIGIHREGIGLDLSSRVINGSEVNDFLVASAEESYNNKPMYLTQRDVREVQLATGAIAAGIRTLMDDMGIEIGDIHRVYLAGALGNYINPLSAMRIGLIPETDPRIVTSLGNAASTGATMVLLSKNYWRMINEIAGFVEHVELSSRLDFNQYFIEHMDFTRGNLW